MELVTLQIKRLQLWSEENKLAGDGAFISHWTLALRKREQNRIENKDRPTDSRSEVVGIPKWLTERLGTGYTAIDMLKVADKLKEEIENGSLSQVPEVEFLPDIVKSSDVNTASPRRRRASNGRKPSEKSNAIHRHEMASVVPNSTGYGQHALTQDHAYPLPGPPSWSLTDESHTVPSCKVLLELAGAGSPGAEKVKPTAWFLRRIDGNNAPSSPDFE